jgi:hypothetical protein
MADLNSLNLREDSAIETTVKDVMEDIITTVLEEHDEEQLISDNDLKRVMMDIVRSIVDCSLGVPFTSETPLQSSEHVLDEDMAVQSGEDDATIEALSISTKCMATEVRNSSGNLVGCSEPEVQTAPAAKPRGRMKRFAASVWRGVKRAAGCLILCGCCGPTDADSYVVHP